MNFHTNTKLFLVHFKTLHIRKCCISVSSSVCFVR